MMENNNEMQGESSAKGGASSKGNENERGDEDSSEFDGTEDEERLDQVPGNYCFYIALPSSFAKGGSGTFSVPFFQFKRNTA